MKIAWEKYIRDHYHDSNNFTFTIRPDSYQNKIKLQASVKNASMAGSVFVVPSVGLLSQNLIKYNDRKFISLQK